MPSSDPSPLARALRLLGAGVLLGVLGVLAGAYLLDGGLTVDEVAAEPTNPPTEVADEPLVVSVDQAPEPTAEPAATAEPEPAFEGPPVTIAFGGDVMFEGMIRPQLDADPEGLLEPIAPLLSDADLAVVNLETAITTGGAPAAKQYAFRAPPSGLLALRAAGVDVASLANNHGMDFGVEGLLDSLAAAEDVGLPLIGAGRDAAEAFAPYVAEVRGRRIAVIGATQVMDTAFIDTWTATDGQPGLASAKGAQEARLVTAVEQARASADTVVVFLHWGIERDECPSGEQQSLARRLVDAGADIVAGGHAHRLQGAGMLGDALVAYGLGNFVFYTAEGPGTHSGVLTVTVDGRDVLGYSWSPATLRNGIPHPVIGEEGASMLLDWEALRGCTGLERGALLSVPADTASG